jgi:hypothetical protein
MAANALKKITTRAKQIYKSGGTWKAAIKKAGAEYRSGKVSGTKKKSKRKSLVKRVRRLHRAEGAAIKKLGRAKRRRRVGATLSAGASGGIMGLRSTQMAAAIGGLSTSQHIAHAKSQLLEQIGWAEAQKYSAKTKRAKRKIGKKVSALKSKFRKLC